MKSFIQLASSRLVLFLQPLMFIGTVLVISLMFPTASRFKYAYERQQIWQYDDLKAPFDFAMLKTDAELRAEQQRIREQASLVYDIDPLVLSPLQTELAEKVNALYAIPGACADASVNVARLTAFINTQLEKTYKQGVLPDVAQLPADRVVTVIYGNTFYEIPAVNLTDVAQLRQQLLDSLTRSGFTPCPELLQYINEWGVANLTYNEKRTDELLDNALGKIVLSSGIIRQGELIVSNNNVITDDIYQKLYSFEQEYLRQTSSEQSLPSVFVGYLILTTLVLVIFSVYLQRHAPLVYNRYSRLAFLLLWIIIYAYLVFIIERLEGISTYMIPFCIVPIVIKTFFNEKLALFTHLAVVLPASFLSSLGFDFLVLQILAGAVVVISQIDTRDWSGFFTVILFIFITYAVGYLGLSLITENSFLDIDKSMGIWFFFNAFLTLLSYPLIPLLERIFGFVSPITLVELSDMNRPLLRELALKAPGTLQHSLQVGNLAEAAARRIKADPLLVRIGALYHDIGKMKQPELFVENQSEIDPHEALSDQQSATAIIDHVAEGVRMAKKAGLPPLVIDFIRTHHGTTRTEYFYRKHLNDVPAAVSNDEAFRYPGPLPRSKEEVILMLADSIEAACRSLKSPTEDELNEFINKIIAHKLKDGQLQEARITFRELEQCRVVFQKIMRSVHHVRVVYPESAEGNDDEAVEITHGF
ncbi:MAG: HDIG domain-containing protein [Saprospiraceae bacterium]